MLRPPTVTASVSGLRRAPLHDRHGISRMNCSSFSRGAVGVGLGVAPLDVREHALVGGPVRALPAVPVLVADVDLLVGAVQQDLARGLRQLLPRHVEREPVRLGRPPRGPGTSTRGVELAHGAIAPSFDRQVGVRDDELGVDLEAGPEAVAGRARAVRRVEREVARRQLVERQAAVRARELLREVLDLLVPRRVVRPRSPRCPRRARAPSRSSRRPDGGCRASRRAGRRRPRSCACRSSGDGSARRGRGPRRRSERGGSPSARGLRGACRTRPCGPGRSGPAPGTGCPRAAPGPGRRSAPGSGGRSGARSSGSAGARPGRRGPGGSRRPR